MYSNLTFHDSIEKAYFDTKYIETRNHKNWTLVNSKDRHFCFIQDQDINLYFELGVKTGEDLFICNPVSYTHLDVYKRQPPGSTKSTNGLCV